MRRSSSCRCWTRPILIFFELFKAFSPRNLKPKNVDFDRFYPKITGLGVLRIVFFL